MIAVADRSFTPQNIWFDFSFSAVSYKFNIRTAWNNALANIYLELIGSPNVCLQTDKGATML